MKEVTSSASTGSSARPTIGLTDAGNEPFALRFAWAIVLVAVVASVLLVIAQLG